MELDPNANFNLMPLFFNQAESPYDFQERAVSASQQLFGIR
jgi:hypothetical protein